MKKLKTTEELIEHLKEKGCRFNIVSEKEAAEFLSENNYYMKLAAYRANYDKIEEGKKAGKYKNLEFAYLKELSTIDMHLRYLIMHMCADIEHSIRTALLKDMENNPDEDGYKCVKLFIDGSDNATQTLLQHKRSEYCKALIEKYYPDFPAWVYVELISFSQLAHLCDTYNKMYKRDFLGFDIRLLNSVRDLRNASAHNNCLINKLNKGTNVPLQPITEYVKRIDEIKSKSRIKKLSNKFIYDFITLIYVYDKTIKSQMVKQNRIDQLKKIVNERMYRNIKYFETNNQIKSSFDFIKKVVDKL